MEQQNIKNNKDLFPQRMKFFKKIHSHPDIYGLATNIFGNAIIWINDNENDENVLIKKSYRPMLPLFFDNTNAYLLSLSTFHETTTPIDEIDYIPIEASKNNLGCPNRAGLLNLNTIYIIDKQKLKSIINFKKKSYQEEFENTKELDLQTQAIIYQKVYEMLVYKQRRLTVIEITNVKPKLTVVEEDNRELYYVPMGKILFSNREQMLKEGKVNNSSQTYNKNYKIILDKEFNTDILDKIKLLTNHYWTITLEQIKQQNNQQTGKSQNTTTPTIKQQINQNNIYKKQNH